MTDHTTLLSGWGKYPKIKTVLKKPTYASEFISILESSVSAIARGRGTSYGDSAINASLTLSTDHLNSMISFDPETGELVAESGVSLADIIETFGPKGFFPPVVPGTRFVSLGGTVASDAHGKNHISISSFGKHVKWIDIWTSREGLVRASPDERADLFWATVGGQGLTGFIMKVCIKLIKVPSLFINQTIIKAKNLLELMDLLTDNLSYPYSYAWVDGCKKGADLGRGHFTGGHFADPSELGKKEKPLELKRQRTFSLPVIFPYFAINRYSLKVYNFMYYSRFITKIHRSVTPCYKFLFPLDTVPNWDRLYGKKGIIQYQFVLPLESSRLGIKEVLERTAKMNLNPNLIVLKHFGPQDVHKGNISFPQRGYSLSLDLPANRHTLDGLPILDSIVVNYAGKHFLTSDSRISATVVKGTYGKSLDEFLEVKSKWDSMCYFNSSLSNRLTIT